MSTQLLQVPTDNFLLEIDHLFIFVTEGRAGVSFLQNLGLHCSEQVVRRPEQGTISTIFFFENTYLELIWIEDENAAQQHTARTGIDFLARARWLQTGASPFGIGLRSLPEMTNLIPGSRKHWAQWMHPDSFIRFSPQNIANAAEPICLAVSSDIALTSWLDRSCERHQQLITHPLGVKKLTSVKIAVDRDKELSEAVSLLDRNGVVAIERDTSPLLELTFDGGVKGEIVDARPTLPMRLLY
ncbi:VOC family protein [Lyngbya sp. CCAP 1446/10]|uniref:VOC family protein n=1 Tax=Lyngbya sp. CCAP 1446/10 TaxID=439293 RepID=UPI0022371882|nr:VOC family protein [Lyngbya sp. CCAP 1446/10]MCW6050910.1 VOC family protein [Lyngbya sp. CCAP 1446/10]